jgi:hypothetical protein
MLDAFERQFKESIKYGMTYEQFWFYDPQLYYIYEEAYLEKLKEKDILNWQLAYYISYSVGTCLAKECKFPKEPLFYAKKENKPQNVYDMRERFEAMVALVNNRF